MNIIESILQQMPGISQAQKKFMVILFSTILLVYGKVNFTNLGRYSSLSEKTYRRHFFKGFNFPEFHKYFINQALNHERTLIAVIDCSFMTKSGKKTEGKASFYNGVAGRPEEGLEISVIAVVEVETHLSYSRACTTNSVASDNRTTEIFPNYQGEKKLKKTGKKNSSIKLTA